MIGGIYKIINKINGKVYVGQTWNFLNRKKKHFQKLRSNTHFNGYLQNAFNKDNQQNFEFVILETIIVGCKRYFAKREQYWIEQYNSLDRNFGYNLMEVWPAQRLSQETIDKLSGENNYAAKLTWETVREIRRLHLNSRLTQEKIAERFDTTRDCVAKVIQNRIWKDSNYMYVQKRHYEHTIAKLTKEQVLKIRQLRDEHGWTYTMLMEEFAVSKGCIQNIIQRRNWRHI